MREKGAALPLILIIIGLIIFSYFFLTTPHKVAGQPIQPFKSEELLLSEKITYLFRKPEIGDRVVFFPTTRGIDYIGIVTEIEETGDVKTYKIVSGENGTIWSVSPEKINSRIYYPLVSKEEIQSIISSLPRGSNQDLVQEYRTLYSTETDGKILLRYKDKIYDDSNQFTMDPIQSNNLDKYPWHKLLSAPEDTKEDSYDEIFSFKVLPNKKDFIFVMRWSKQRPPNFLDQEFRVFYFDNNTDQVSNLVNFIPDSDTSEYNIVKIDQISTDGKYVSFDMYGCWNCGGHKPETLLMNLETKERKRIGKVLLFNWKEDGAYEYKDYIVKECPEPTPGECSEDEKNLPFRMGKF